jgi:DUF1365 family protein
MLRARDTSEGAFERQFAAFRAMTPAQRLAIAAEMSDEIRVIAEAGIRNRHPSYTEGQVAGALAEILLGRALAGKVGRWRQSLPR